MSETSVITREATATESLALAIIDLCNVIDDYTEPVRGVTRTDTARQLALLVLGEDNEDE